MTTGEPNSMNNEQLIKKPDSAQSNSISQNEIGVFGDPRINPETGLVTGFKPVKTENSDKPVKVDAATGLITSVGLGKSVEKELGMHPGMVVSKVKGGLEKVSDQGLIIDDKGTVKNAEAEIRIAPKDNLNKIVINGSGQTKTVEVNPVVNETQTEAEVKTESVPVKEAVKKKKRVKGLTEEELNYYENYGNKPGQVSRDNARALERQAAEDKNRSLLESAKRAVMAKQENSNSNLSTIEKWAELVTKLRDPKNFDAEHYYDYLRELNGYANEMGWSEEKHSKMIDAVWQSVSEQENAGLPIKKPESVKEEVNAGMENPVIETINETGKDETNIGMEDPVVEVPEQVVLSDLMREYYEIRKEIDEMTSGKTAMDQEGIDWRQNRFAVLRGMIESELIGKGMTMEDARAYMESWKPTEGETEESAGMAEPVVEPIKDIPVEENLIRAEAEAVGEADGMNDEALPVLEGQFRVEATENTPEPNSLAAEPIVIETREAKRKERKSFFTKVKEAAGRAVEGVKNFFRRTSEGMSDVRKKADEKYSAEARKTTRMERAKKEMEDLDNYYSAINRIMSDGREMYNSRTDTVLPPNPFTAEEYEAMETALGGVDVWSDAYKERLERARARKDESKKVAGRVRARAAAGA